MDLGTFEASAAWFPQQVDLLYGRVLLVKLTEDDYHRSMFLDQRLAADRPEKRVADLWKLASAIAGRPSPPAVMVFHVGHCGSTLLSRVLQEAAGALCLREPVPLRALAAMERQAADPVAVMDPARLPLLRRFVFGAYARRFRTDQPVVVKGTSSCSNLLPHFLEQQVGHRAVFLYLRLEPFLATLLRSDQMRQETASFAQSRLQDLHAFVGDDSERIYRMSAGQLAAMSWAANLLWLLRFRDRFASRLCPVDFETLLDAPESGLGRIARETGIGTTPEDLRAAYHHVTASYSKDPSVRYSRAMREAQLDRCRREWPEEIRRGLAWAEALCRRHPEAAPLAEFLAR